MKHRLGPSAPDEHEFNVDDNYRHSPLVIMAKRCLSLRGGGTATHRPFVSDNRFSSQKSKLLLFSASLPTVYGILFSTLAVTPSRAADNIKVTYKISYLGITIGRAELGVELAKKNYLITASGNVKGMMSILINGQGSVAAQGEISNRGLTPGSFDAHVVSTAENDDIRMTIESGAVKRLVAEPPFAPTPKRVPLTEDVLHGVIDPLTATVRIPPSSSAAEIAPDACAHKLPIFDGRRRYDVNLAYKMTEDISVGTDYRGTAFVCSAHLVPIAGQQVDSSAVNYLVKSNDIEISFVSIPEASVLVPISAIVPTLIGTIHVNPEEIEANKASPH